MLKQVQVAIVAGLLSISAFAQEDHLVKVAKMMELSTLQKEIPELDLTPFERELKYEAQALSLEERARIETNLLADSIRKEVHESYASAFERLGDADAAGEEVRDQIENDVELFDPSLKEEILKLALDELQKAQSDQGGKSVEVNLANVEKFMLEGSTQRSAFFNQTGVAETPKSLKNALSAIYDQDNSAFSQMASSTKSDLNAERTSYNNEQELLTAMNSQKPGTRWLSTGGWIMDLQSATRLEGRVHVQVRVEFLGNNVNAGAALNVKQEYIANLKLIADDKQLLINDQGRFDFNERDEMGNIVKENGKPKRRWLAFACEAILFYEVDKSASAGFVVSGGIGNVVPGYGAKLEGGASATAGKANRSFVNNQSRRLVIPESIGGQVVTAERLKNICFNKYDKFKVNARMTVMDVLKLQVRNLMKMVTVKHPNMNCAVDTHCNGWFNKRYLNKFGRSATARCATNTREHIKNCVVRSARNAKCPVFEGSKLVSNGVNELPCDIGLRCAKVKEKGWFTTLSSVYQYAEGRCLPINSKTYRGPVKR